jgi:hypothetical protein
MIYAASILGAKKVHLSSLGIAWRKHAVNFSSRQYTAQDIVMREQAIEEAFAWYCSKYNISRYPSIREFFQEYDQLGPIWQKRLDLPSRYRMLNRLLRKSLLQTFTKRT